MTQYSIRPKWSAIRTQAVYFVHQTTPSVTYLQLSDVSVICRVTYFQFPIQSGFLPYIGRQAAQPLRRTTGFNEQYRTSDVAKNLGRYVSCTERTSQGKDFQLILTVKKRMWLTVDSSQLTFLPSSKSRDTKTKTNIKISARRNRDILCPSLRISGQLPAPIVNGGRYSFCKWKDFQLLRARDLDLDLGSGHTAYRRASLIDLYLHAKFHWNRRNFLWTDGRTYGRTLSLY